MTHSNSGLSREVVIVNELGLHARSAAKIAALAHLSKAAIWLKKGTERADATSILDILTLGCEKGSRITVSVENKADTDILAAITELIANGFEEPSD